LPHAKRLAPVWCLFLVSPLASKFSVLVCVFSPLSLLCIAFSCPFCSILFLCLTIS
jgi:hypothetical protein